MPCRRPQLTIAIALTLVFANNSQAVWAQSESQDATRFRVQTDITPTSRVNQEQSTQFVQQIQTNEVSTVEGELHAGTFEETDPTEYEATQELVNLTREPVDVDFHPEIGNYDLDGGSVLVRPDKDTTVTTDEGQITVGAGCVAVVLKRDDGVTVLDLYDAHRGTVLVRTVDGVISMKPGMQVTLTKHPSKSLKELHPALFVGHRHLREMRAADGTRVFMADYSMFSAVAHMKRIRDLAKSKNKEDRQLFEKILKTAASITVLHGMEKEKFTML